MSGLLMEELCDKIQYEEYCKEEPITPNEWEDIKLAWENGILDHDPFLLDDETAIERALRRIH